MAGTVFKQCRYKGCERSPRCKHPWWLSFSKRGRRYRMTADDFAKKPVPSKAEAAEVWLPKFIMEIREGRNPTSADAASPDEMTVGRFIEEEYIPRHIKASNLSYEVALKSRMNVLKRRFGDLPLTALEKPGPIENFKSDLQGAGRAVATINLYLAHLRHMINWAIGRGLLEQSPFHKYGIRMLKGAAKRTRRLHPDEEARLLEGTETLNNPRHWFQGIRMKDRVIGALDTGARRGELLLVQNNHIDWKHDLPRVFFPGENTKWGRERFVPVGTTRD